MSFEYRNGVLHAEDVALDEIARRHGTPCYVYSRASIESTYREYSAALAGRPSLIAYSVKANSNLAVLGVISRLGAGFDIHVVDPRTLAITGPDGSTTQLNLDRVAAFCAANQDSCDPVLSEYLDQVTVMLQGDNGPLPAERLRAVVRGADFLEQMNKQLGGTENRKIVATHIPEAA